MISEAIISVVLATSWLSRTYPAGKVAHESILACLFRGPSLAQWRIDSLLSDCISAAKKVWILLNR